MDITELRHLLTAALVLGLISRSEMERVTTAATEAEADPNGAVEGLDERAQAESCSRHAGTAEVWFRLRAVLLRRRGGEPISASNASAAEARAFAGAGLELE